MSTATDQQHAIAREYVSDYWSDVVSGVGLRAALTDAPEVHDEDIIDEEDDSYAPIASIPLRDALRIDDAMFNAIIAADENIRRKVEAQYDKTLIPGVNETYDSRCSADLGIVHRSGALSLLASCQGGDEMDMIYMHPIHGVSEKMDAAEYRERTSPYVAAFGVEVYPGDLSAGLVHSEVVDALPQNKDGKR